MGGIHPAPFRRIWWERGHGIRRKTLAKKLITELVRISHWRKNARALPQFVEKDITTYEAGCPCQKQRFHSFGRKHAKAARRASGGICD